MSEKIRVVLVGCGGICGGWWNAIKDNPTVEIVGLVDVREEAALKRKADFGLPDAHIGTNLGVMLAEVSPDAVFDCTIPDAHTEVTLTALAHGCHVLGEKPLAGSMENARRAVAAAKQSGKTYAVIQNRRYDSRIRSLRAFLESGAVGNVTTVNADFYIGAHFGGFRDNMKHVLLLDMAIHSFDQARLISGADPVSVYCHEWNPKGSWYDHDASAIAIFEMSNGMVFTYRGSWCSEGRNTSWECDWRVVAERGSVLWDGADAFSAEKVVNDEGFFREKQALEVPVEAWEGKVGGHKGVIEEFLRCIRTGETPETVCWDNIKSLAMVFGAIESAETGKKVMIEI